VLYAGLMLTPDGPKLIEYNVRFGDPECQVLMLRLMSDLVPALLACCDGMLRNFDLRWFSDAALTVVMAPRVIRKATSRAPRSRGSKPLPRSRACRFSMPAPWRRAAASSPMGARAQRFGARKTVGEAQRRAYQAIDHIRWADGFFRRDIGYLAVEREAAARP